MKHCNTCRRILPTSAFSLSRRKRDGRQARCRECWRRDYVTNREHRKSVAARNAQRSLARHRDKIAAYLAEHPWALHAMEDSTGCSIGSRTPHPAASAMLPGVSDGQTVPIV
jgi:hypothetical protein